jgi:hypothetical protein
MPLKKSTKRILYGLYLLFWVGVAYAAIVALRAYRLYEYARNSIIMSSGMFLADDELGFGPRPNTSGTLFFPDPPHIPVRYDENGFRVPMQHDTAATNLSRSLLTLGGSFTEGFACAAEDTYPYLLGEKLGARTLSAGFGAYGLGQMLILARRLIPERKPAYVIVQYSPWLISRALNEYAPNDIGKRPQPFFYRRPDGRLDLHGPVFRTSAFDYPVADVRDHPGGRRHFAAFLFRVGFPFFVSNDLQVGLFRLKQALGVVPRPDDNRLEVLRYAYGEMSRLCRETGSTMVVCSLAHPWDLPRPEEVEILKAMDGVIFVDAWGALTNALPDTATETYEQAYAHYRGDPPVHVDGHPNPAAHAMIADAIARKIPH